MDKKTVFAILGEPKAKTVDVSGEDLLEKWQYELKDLKNSGDHLPAGKGHEGRRVLDPPVEDHLARLAADHHLEALSEPLNLVAVGDDRAHIEARLHHRGHLVPGLEHLASVDALQEQPLEDDLAPVNRDLLPENPEERDPAAVGHRVDHRLERDAHTAHLEADVEALGHPEI